MKIHLVVSIAQLEPAEGADPYNRKTPNHPGPVEMEDTALSSDNHEQKHMDSHAGETYKVEQIIGKRRRRYRRGEPRVEYQMK